MTSALASDLLTDLAPNTELERRPLSFGERASSPSLPYTHHFDMALPADFDHEQNERNMLVGELYYAFTPKLSEERTKCARACSKFNQKAADLQRREQLELLVE
jgi:hypothetical protein